MFINEFLLSNNLDLWWLASISWWLNENKSNKGSPDTVSQARSILGCSCKHLKMAIRTKHVVQRQRRQYCIRRYPGKPGLICYDCGPCLRESVPKVHGKHSVHSNKLVFSMDWYYYFILSRYIFFYKKNGNTWKDSYPLLFQIGRMVRLMHI
jgi:hypothetical protein